MRVISFVIIVVLSFDGFSQTVEFDFDQLKKAIESRSLESLEMDTTLSYFSIRKGKKCTFHEVPVSMLRANNDFFLSRKKVRAEYSFTHSDNGFIIDLYDVNLDKDFKIFVKSSMGQDFFVRFFHGKRNYFRIRACDNCAFTVVEEGRED